ncbi:hypothetical protein V8F20_006156 [Naviculisporaceae sp. PSN 640]
MNSSRWATIACICCISLYAGQKRVKSFYNRPVTGTRRQPLFPTKARYCLWRCTPSSALQPCQAAKLSLPGLKTSPCRHLHWLLVEVGQNTGIDAAKIDIRPLIFTFVYRFELALVVFLQAVSPQLISLGLIQASYQTSFTEDNVQTSKQARQLTGELVSGRQSPPRSSLSPQRCPVNGANSGAMTETDRPFSTIIVFLQMS